MTTSETGGTLTLRVGGMTCRHCVRDVTARLRDVPGVTTVAADARLAHVVVRGTMAAADVLAAVAAAGFTVDVVGGPHEADADPPGTETP